MPRPSAGCFLENVTISAGQTISGGISFAPGIRDIPPHLVRKGTIPKLRWISTKYVVFWDELDKRGWLINGTSALLHMLRASLEHYRTDDFSTSFMFDFSRFHDAPDHTSKSAIRVLTDESNRKLEIYPGRIRRVETLNLSGDTINSSGQSEMQMEYFLLDDLIDQHFTTLEQMIDHHAKLAGRNGINLKKRVRKHLEGWDLGDIIQDIDPLPRVAKIPAFGHGWIDFVRSIGSITLFGRGLGELIKPSLPNLMCSRWGSLPEQQYLLAAAVSDLQIIMARFGDANHVPRLLTDDVYWHSPAAENDRCACQSHLNYGPVSKRDHLDLIQGLSSTPKVLDLTHRLAIKPQPLHERGAVVFSHNAKWGSPWPESEKRPTLETQDSDVTILNPITSLSDQEAIIVCDDSLEPSPLDSTTALALSLPMDGSEDPLAINGRIPQNANPKQSILKLVPLRIRQRWNARRLISTGSKLSATDA